MSKVQRLQTDPLLKQGQIISLRKADFHMHAWIKVAREMFAILENQHEISSDSDTQKTTLLRVSVIASRWVSV